MLAATFLTLAFPALIAAAPYAPVMARTMNLTLSTQSVDGSVRNLNGAVVAIQSASYAPPQPLILLPTPNAGFTPPAYGYLEGQPDRNGQLNHGLSLFLAHDSNHPQNYTARIQSGEPAAVLAVKPGPGAEAYELVNGTQPELVYAQAGGFLGCESTNKAYAGYRLYYGNAGVTKDDSCTAVKVLVHYH